ncbi:hypothetical protein ACFRCI_05260 [Streptomyces sp. NPDC056638]|uniref:hypothetical protein n=1 Tax=Streptomyces sp. NPDC056638 TaxID=3345887 RepID=UPI0036C53416
MIEPGGIPQYTGDFGQLEKAASSLRTHATDIRTGGKDVHSRFQATAAYYKAPEADKLFSSTQPVMDTAEEFAGDIEALADALDTFIFEAKPHADRLKQLKLDAFTFVDSVRGDDDWTEDQTKVDAHQALLDGVVAAREAFQEAERNAANKINAISPGMCRPQWVVDDGTHGLGMYGQSADALKDVKDLPWGSPEGRTYERWSLEWWGHGAKSWAWDGIVKDSIWGGIDGLGTLAGFHGAQERDQAWDGLRRTVVSGYAYGMDLFGQDEHLTGWQRDSKVYAKEFGKQFIAYDMTAEDPARAHAVVSFNLLTLASGPLAAASKLGKGGTFAKAAGTMAKIGDALDPLGGAFKAAKALSDLPKVSQVLANVSDHLQIPKTKFPDGALDLSDRYRVDKDGKFIPLDREGKPHLEPAKRELSAAERGVGGRQGDREPVGVGGRAPGAAAHVGDNLPPRGGHDVGGSGEGGTHQGAGRDTSGGTGSAGRAADDSASGAGHHGRDSAESGTVPDTPGHGHGPADPSSGTPPHELPDPHQTNPAPDDAGGHGEPAMPTEAHPAPDGPPGIDPAKYTKDVNDLAQTHTGRMKPEQEAGVVAELNRARMPPRSQESLLASLRKGPYGAGAAEMISRGHLRDMEGYNKLLDMCKQGPTKKEPGMVPAAYMAMRLATDLQEHGVGRIGVELDTATFDLDVYTRHPDGAIDYGYQLKDVGNISGINSAVKKAAKQLTHDGISHRVILLDIHQSMTDLTQRMFDEASFQARRMNGAVHLRFADGSIIVPPTRSTFP